MEKFERIVVKTAVKTVLILLGIVIVSLGVLNIAFPQYMATFTENIGNYSLAVKYASLRYTYTGDVYDLARCVDDSILSGKDEFILEYGEKLIGSDGYEQVAEYKNTQVLNGAMDYGLFVSGKVAAAKYSLGDFDGALELALASNGATSFKKGNPLAALAAKVRERDDAVSAEKLLRVLDNVNPVDEEEAHYKNELYKLVKTVTLSQ